MFVTLTTIVLTFSCFLLIQFLMRSNWMWKKEGILIEIGVLTAMRQMIKHNWRIGYWLKEIADCSKIYAVNFLGQRMIFINDVGIALEVLSKSSMNDRPRSFDWIRPGGINAGFPFQNGQMWTEQRKLASKFLSPSTGNRRSTNMDHLISDQMEEFIKSVPDGPFCPTEKFYLPIINSLWMVLAGQRFAQNDSKMIQVTRVVDDHVKSITQLKTYIAVRWSWTTLILSKYFKITQLRETHDYSQLFLHALVDEHKENFVPSDYPLNYIDAYLQYNENPALRNSSFSFVQDGESNLVGNLTSLAVAGGKSTASTLEWCVLHLSRHVEIQRKIQLELDLVVGPDRFPTLDDRPKCPYTTSFIYEVLRVNPAFKATPMNLVQEDYLLEGGIMIHKGDWICLNINGTHNDPLIWGDPEIFRPSRFLDPDHPNRLSQRVVNQVVSFGVGKRSCPGQKLALNNLFIFVSAICHQFSLNVGEEEGGKSQSLPPSTCEGPSIVSSPDPFSIFVERRI